MIVELQEAGKIAEDKQRFTIRKIILILEESETSIILLEKNLTHTYRQRMLNTDDRC